MITYIIFLCCIITVVVSAVDVKPSPVAKVTEGATLWLACTYDLGGGRLGQLQWKENDNSNVARVSPTANPQCSTTSDNYSIDCRNLASNEVRLGIINPVNGDTYSCYVFLSNFTLIGNVSTQVSVVVLVTNVTFTLPVSDQVIVTPGNSQVYTCVTGSCRPAARIEWYKDGVNITTQTGSVSSTGGDKFVTTSSLTLTGTRGDTTPATVQCRASNVDGMSPVVSADKTFVVQWAPDGPPVITGYTSVTILYVNDTLPLRCRQPGGNPRATLTWGGVCGGIPPTNSNTQTEAVSEITITVTKGYNQATCTCVSNHPQPQTQDRTQVTFTVHYPPSMPVVSQTPTQPWLAGNNGTLTCSYTDGFPTSTRIEWFRNGVKTGQSTPTITLGPLSHMDNRVGYSCRVLNDFTDTKHTNLTSAVTTLNVEYKPLVTLTRTQLTVIEGKTGQITCEAVGNPTPNLKWLRGGSLLHTGAGTSLTLTLENVDRTATADYICRAEGVSTVQGRQLITERSVSVLVQYPPEVSLRVVPLTVAEGDKDVRLVCLTTGEPNTLVSLSWTQSIDQTFITDQFTYETAAQTTIFLSEVSLDDTGTYTCSASNGIPDRQGQTLQSNNTVLDVIVAPKFNTSGQNRNFYSKLHEPLTIEIPFYSNPPVLSTANLQWTKSTTGALIIESVNITFGLLGDVDINLIVKGKMAAFSGQAAVMIIRSFQQSLAGTYTVTINNDGRQSTTNFTVTPSGPPELPIFQVIAITATSITVKWTKGFNGGHPQTFAILYGPVGATPTQRVLVEEQHHLTYSHEITGLKPNTRYQLNMYAYNDIGNSSLSSAASIIRKTPEADAGVGVPAIAGGVGGSVVALVIITAVAVVLYRRRNDGGGKDTSQRSDDVLFSSDNNEEDGLKRNILYESAGPYRSDNGQDENATDKDEYAMVVKKNKNVKGAEYAEVIPKKDRKGKTETPAENGDLYAEVQKTEKGKPKAKKSANEGQKKGKPKAKKSANEGQIGTVYENVGAVGGKPEELYANNADDESKPVKTIPKDQTPSRKKNNEGLVYLDVEFKESQSGTRQAVIHGIENRTDYAEVDFTKHAEPLQEGNSIHNVSTIAKDGKQDL